MKMKRKLRVRRVVGRVYYLVGKTVVYASVTVMLLYLISYLGGQLAKLLDLAMKFVLGIPKPALPLMGFTAFVMVLFMVLYDERRHINQ